MPARKVESIEHLKGLKIPSLDDMAAEAMWYIGTAGVINLSIAADRERLRSALRRSLQLSLRWYFEPAIESAAQRAVKHVFAMADDPEYQGKRSKDRERARKAAALRKAEKARQAVAAAEERRQKTREARRK